jgi:hypothetical protein
LVLYGKLGSKVSTYAESQNYSPGFYKFDYDVTDLNPGVYFIRFKSGKNTKTGKIVISK